MKKSRDVFYSGLTKLSKKWEHYFDIYDKYLPQFENKHPNILEVGIAHGGCVEWLLKYFDNQASISAVDYDPRFIDLEYPNSDVNITLGDQASEQFWDDYLKDNPQYDIIIDDGGHDMVQQVITLLKTFPHLKEGGVYIVEDTHTSYWPQYGGGINTPTTFIEYAKKLADLLHSPYIANATPPLIISDTFKNLSCITFYNSIVVFEKKASAPCVEAVSNKT